MNIRTGGKMHPTTRVFVKTVRIWMRLGSNCQDQQPMLFVVGKLLIVIICWAWPGNFGRVVSAEKSKLITYGWGLLALVLWTIDLNRQQPVYSTQKPRSAQQCTFYFQSVLPCSMCMLRVRNASLFALTKQHRCEHLIHSCSIEVIRDCDIILSHNAWKFLRLLPLIYPSTITIHRFDTCCGRHQRWVKLPWLHKIWASDLVQHLLHSIQRMHVRFTIVYVFP